MKKMLIAGLMCMAFVNAKAQNIEDALRFAVPNGLLTPRAAGLNVAYNGLADDAAAMLVNPAGLTLLGKSEINAGFGFLVNSNNSEFVGDKTKFTANNEYLNNISIVSPARFGKNRSAVGIGYFLESNYSNSYKFEGLNTQNTFIAQQANIKAPWVNYLQVVGNDYATDIRDSLQQNSFIREDGGLHNIVGSIAFDLSDNVSLGFSLIGKIGSYEYEKEYCEADIYNLYKTYQVNDINRVDVREKLTQDIGGITGMVGLQFRVEDFFRGGINIKFPTFYSIDESFSQSYKATFDPNPGTGEVESFDKTYDGNNSYKLHTPFVYSAGFSMNVAGAVFTAGVDYSDVTQMIFSDATEGVESLNNLIIQQLVGQVTWGFGGEYRIPLTPFIVRASYANTTSPYAEDIADATKSYISLGGSVILSQGLKIDAVFRWTDVSELRSNYGTADNIAYYSKYIVSQSPTNIALGVTYRY